MTQDTLEHLFEPFFTTRPDGNGLGLATAFEIVTSYSGGMNVMSRLGEGTTMEVWLPLAETDTGAAAESLLRVLGRGETVLVVNEDANRLLHDEEVVAALGYEPAGFFDPHEAVEACRRAKQRFDIILLSNIQSTVSALALAADLHAILPNVPIILAAASNGLSADALATAGISEVIKTPIMSAELASALPRWVLAHL